MLATHSAPHQQVSRNDNTSTIMHPSNKASDCEFDANREPMGEKSSAPPSHPPASLLHQHPMLHNQPQTNSKTLQSQPPSVPTHHISTIDGPPDPDVVSDNNAILHKKHIR